MREDRYRCRGFSLNEVYLAKVSELACIFGCSESEVIRRAIDFYYFHVFRDLSQIDLERFSKMKGLRFKLLEGLRWDE